MKNKMKFKPLKHTGRSASFLLFVGYCIDQVSSTTIVQLDLLHHGHSSIANCSDCTPSLKSDIDLSRN